MVVVVVVGKESAEQVLAPSGSALHLNAGGSKVVCSSEVCLLKRSNNAPSDMRRFLVVGVFISHKYME